MDLSKLSDEQLDVALKVAEAAKRQGLNPDFVLPMVMAESGFKQDAVSPSGAIGVMQLIPKTASSLKVDPKNIDENIDGGMRLLKELIQNPKIGNDPYKVLAGYNASTETRNKFYESGNLADLKDETIDHMIKVSEYYGGELPKATIEQADSSAAKDEAKGAIDERGNKPVSEAEPHELDTMPITAQSLITGGAGASLAAGAGLAHPFLVWGAKRILGQGDGGAQPVAPNVPEVQSSNWPGNRTPAATTPSHSERQVLSTGDKSDMTGRERQIGYTENTAQKAARKDTQYGTAKSVGLDPNRAFAEHPDVASTRGGILASKQTIDELQGQQLAAKNAQAQRGLNAANISGQQWQTLVNQAKTFMQSGTPQEKAWAAKVLDKVMGGAKNVMNSFAGRAGQIGFGAGASVPLAWEAYQNDNPKTAAAIVGAGTAMGALANKFPRAMPALGGLATIGYDVTHPRQAAAAMNMRDVSPTAFTGMPEEYEPAFPEYQNRGAGGGRGFVNPPLANP
jgi:hypothetical protein